jgi:hypothetical protein
MSTLASSKHEIAKNNFFFSEVQTVILSDSYKWMQVYDSKE